MWRKLNTWYLSSTGICLDDCGLDIIGTLERVMNQLKCKLTTSISSKRKMLASRMSVVAEDDGIDRMERR